jgi:hypothetical protein
LLLLLLLLQGCAKLWQYALPTSMCQDLGVTHGANKQHTGTKHYTRFDGSGRQGLRFRVKPLPAQQQQELQDKVRWCAAPALM